MHLNEELRKKFEKEKECEELLNASIKRKSVKTTQCQVLNYQ